MAQEYPAAASVVAGFLSEYGIIVEKTGPYSLLFLFSLGVDKTKSLTLLKALSEFKYFYDKNALVHEVLPELFSKDPVFYKNMRIQALAHGIHKLIVKHRLPELMYEAFETLPQMAMTPHRAFQQEILGNTCECLLSEMTDKISANMILPYPPGVPLIMPGEKLTGQNRPRPDVARRTAQARNVDPVEHKDLVPRYWPATETDSPR